MYKANQLVHHKLFEEGKILEIKGDRVLVDFTSHQKRLSLKILKNNLEILKIIE